jgi:hypothetical protein
MGEQRARIRELEAENVRLKRLLEQQAREIAHNLLRVAEWAEL